jgi:hypothetical protein
MQHFPLIFLLFLITPVRLISLDLITPIIFREDLHIRVHKDKYIMLRWGITHSTPTDTARTSLTTVTRTSDTTTCTSIKSNDTMDISSCNLETTELSYSPILYKAKESFSCRILQIWVQIFDIIHFYPPFNSERIIIKRKQAFLFMANENYLFIRGDRAACTGRGTYRLIQVTVGSQEGLQNSIVLVIMP